MKKTINYENMKTQPWTELWDMHSGGRMKTNYHYIYINLPVSDAINWFENEFKIDAHNTTCDCCGEDFSITPYDTLEEATKFHRGDTTIEAFASKPDVLIVEVSQ